MFSLEVYARARLNRVVKGCITRVRSVVATAIGTRVKDDVETRPPRAYNLILRRPGGCQCTPLTSQVVFDILGTRLSLYDLSIRNFELNFVRLVMKILQSVQSMHYRTN